MLIQDDVIASNIVPPERCLVNRELVATNLSYSSNVDKWITLFTGLKLKYM